MQTNFSKIKRTEAKLVLYIIPSKAISVQLWLLGYKEIVSDSVEERENIPPSKT